MKIFGARIFYKILARAHFVSCLGMRARSFFLFSSRYEFGTSSDVINVRFLSNVIMTDLQTDMLHFSRESLRENSGTSGITLTKTGHLLRRQRYVQNVMARVYQYDELAHINVMDEVI